MRLAWATDIHLNFVDRETAGRFCEEVEGSGADRLVISGDIAESFDLGETLGFLADRLPCPIDFVLGNHDYYGSRIADIRAAMAEVTRRITPLNWLPESGVLSICPEVALLGHDGWGDARLGDFAGSTIRLNDYRLIGELSGLDRMSLARVLRSLGDEAASFARRALPHALQRHRSAIFATHVPPFRESCVFKGRVANDEWAPHFSCGSLGDALVEVMTRSPDRRLLVLCGHVHNPAVARILPNLVAMTGGAEYRRPEVCRVFDVPADLDALFEDQDRPVTV
ncbi:metallophosphoesterase family protein [Tautonia plasticadhaerens]|uniref:Calcineurin-like phosphoesterase superfamily domain protein n=1 Tax=Tautonia plasticadhaerens TaxID=2527974 RepID=A0A518GY15_9BACT|nr:metallophosphoesterase [Tautonia plasticadhaerens]QDV33475.1 Calcineurin-like phosphoesterase superfamily domain protein [Tautonia plasticadhaerens]